MRGSKTWVLTVILAAALMASGCAQLKDKFVPKKKDKDVLTKRYLAVREYDVHPSMELYIKRYIFWKEWHKELLSVMNGTNRKKTMVAVEQEVSNLMSMRDMLEDEKGDKLSVPLDELINIEKDIRVNGVTRGNKVRIRRKLESLGREIKKDYTYNKMRGFIRDDFRNE